VRYGGSAFTWLLHNNRFKTFIAHDGVFNTQSMFGTTEEVLLIGFCGAYWEKTMQLLKKTYTTFNPASLVENGTPYTYFSRR
jgi:hypothetical protein